MKGTLLKFSAIAFVGFLSANTNSLHAQTFGGFAAGVTAAINGNAQTFNVGGSGADQINPGGPNFSDGLGTFVQNSATLRLTGGEVKTYKGLGANVCGVTFKYNVYPSCSSCSQVPPQMDFYFKADCDNGVFADGYGPCSFGDQKWRRDDTVIDLTNRPPGVYSLNIRYDIIGGTGSGCDGMATYGEIWEWPLRTAKFTIVAASSARPAAENVSGVTVSTNGATRLSVYPMPVTSTASINPVNFDEGSIQIEITNIQGSATKKVGGAYTKGQNINLDMSSYAADMYFIRLQQGTKSATAKVVKQ